MFATLHVLETKFMQVLFNRVCENPGFYRGNYFCIDGRIAFIYLGEENFDT